MGHTGGQPMDRPRDVPGDGAGDVPGEWVSVSEAARRLGVSRRAIRGRIERGRLTVRDGNAGRAVFVPHGMIPGDVRQGSAEVPENDHGAVPAVSHGTDGIAALEQLRADLEAERGCREAAELRAAVATREVELLRERVAELRLLADELRRARYRAEAEVDGLRERLDRSTTRADGFQERLEVATVEVAELRDRLAWRPWWRRMIGR